MAYKEYFPLGIAEGKAFCNRLAERQSLLSNLQAGEHTLITASRRHGKSSLILFALQESGLPYVDVDLFVTIDAKSVEKQLLKGIKKIINEVNSVAEQTIQIISDYVKSLNTKWVIGMSGLYIELVPEQSSDPADNILEALFMLDNLLAKKQITAVLFIDEFQEIGELADCRGIEGAIRHVAQKTKYLTFVFSGSNRRMLLEMFQDRSRPLYKLCDHMVLHKIAAEHYVAYLNKAAKIVWKTILSDEVLAEIFKHTERHPYYMNALCNKLWTILAHPPSIKEVQNTWQQYVVTERPNVVKELSALSSGQVKLLIAIASEIKTKLTSKDFLQKVNLTSATVVQALNVLAEKDYIYQDDQGIYNLVDPLIKTTLQLHYKDYF